MSITFLANVKPGPLNYIICVRVSRMWEFRGRDEENEIKHLDLVVIDQKGYTMYAEIPPDAIPLLRPHLQEGKIVYMAKITIHNAKLGYRPVESPYMIRLNIRTQIPQLQDEPSDFPKYTFSLTPFPNLYQYTGNTEKFLDVIGRVLAVSNAGRVLTSSGTLKWKRIVHLGDLSGNMIELSLWGPRALEFQGETVYNIGQNNHVIAIFVGTSMKCIKESSYFLSGTAACRWYLNENDIPEIKLFQKSLPTIPDQAVKKIDLLSADDIEKHIELTTCVQLKGTKI